MRTLILLLVVTLSMLAACSVKPTINIDVANLIPPESALAIVNEFAKNKQCRYTVDGVYIGQNTAIVPYDKLYLDVYYLVIANGIRQYYVWGYDGPGTFATGICPLQNGPIVKQPEWTNYDTQLHRLGTAWVSLGGKMH